MIDCDHVPGDSPSTSWAFPSRCLVLTLVASAEPERLRGAAVTAGYLRTLGVEPVLGRVFTADDDRPGAPAVALLGYDLWQRRFGADDAAIGRGLTLEEGPHVVVGVLPRGFDIPYSAEVWLPMRVSATALPLDQRAATANEFVARLAPGASIQQQDYPQIRHGWSFGIVPLRQQLMADLEGRTRRSLLALVVSVACLLLICCANVAGLVLARGVAREAEVAIRLALGAGRGRVVQQLLAESLMLALIASSMSATVRQVPGSRS